MITQERAFRAHEQPGEIIAGRGFAGAARGLDDPSVGHDHGQRQDVLAHRAIAHRIGARGAGRGHAAQRGVGAGVDREEQPRGLQMLVQLLAGDAGLDGDVQIIGRHPQDPVHPADIDAHPAAGGGHAAFQRGAGAEGDDRHGHGRRTASPPRPPLRWFRGRPPHRAPRHRDSSRRGHAVRAPPGRWETRSPRICAKGRDESVVDGRGDGPGGG